MYHSYNKTHKKTQLWNANYILLIVANVLLYFSCYAQIPTLSRTLSVQWLMPDAQAILIALLPAVALPLLGLFNNYLVDAFKRKNVYTVATFLMALCTLGTVYIGSQEGVIVLRLLQGALMGIAVMATGSVLSIDISPSNTRNLANFYFACSGILGALAGISVGYSVVAVHTNEMLMSISAVLMALSGVIVSMVHVCFRAPLSVSMCSLDRFVLCRSLPQGINMLAIPMILGMLCVAIRDAGFCIALGIGYFCFLLVKRIFRLSMKGRKVMLSGILLATLALTLMWLLTGVGYYIASGALGFAIGLIASHFLRIMILLPKHCERGSGFHTFVWLWELGIFLGVLYYIYVVSDSEALWKHTLGFVVIAALGYVLFSYPHFKHIMLQREKESNQYK